MGGIFVMKKIITITVLVYLTLLIPLFTIMAPSRGFKNENFYLQITQADGISYHAVKDWNALLPMDYFEYAISYDFSGQILYDGKSVNTTFRVWKEVIADKRIEDTLAFYVQISPFFAKGNTGLFVYPPVASAETPFTGEIMVNDKQVLLKGEYSIDGLPMHSDLLMVAYEQGFLSHDTSLTFLPDDLMLSYYNEQNATDLQSLEELKYDSLLIEIPYQYLPPKREINQFIKALEDQGYEICRSIQQSEILWRNNRIFYFTTVTVIMSAITAFLVIRKKRKQA